MAALPYTEALKAEYARLWVSLTLRPARRAAVHALATRIRANRTRYQVVARRASVSWVFVGLIHAMEAGLRFDRHLHNGDPLSARTVHVPAGRPLSGTPPFTWEDSAADALNLRRIAPDTDWSAPGLAYQLEAYNGFGYRLRHPDVLSPYLWSFTPHYRAGKYVADGAFSAEAVSQQAGAMALLLALCEQDAELAALYRPGAMPAHEGLWTRFVHWLKAG